MSGARSKHNPLLANGEEVGVIGSVKGISLPGVDRILFATASLQSVDTAGEAATALTTTEVIAADGKSFDIYVWDAAGAASSAAVTLKWFASVE